MSEAWQTTLYPLGFLASLAFGGRFLLQWIASEMKQESIVNRLFWWLSLAGTTTLVIHGMIQMQFHVCVIQGCNGVIACRNLNLMQAPERQVKKSTVIATLFGAVLLMTVLFFLQGWLLGTQTSWFRIPNTPWLQQKDAVSPLWHLVGFVGMALFSSRFWIQWWLVEKHQKSYLGPAFWWMSLIGGSLSCIYFLHIRDLVNLIGPGFGLIPYLRNLILIQRSKARQVLHENPS